MSFGQMMSDPIDLAQGSQLNARSPSALGIEAASFASGTGFGNGEWDLGIWKRFLSEEKFSEQRYSGKPDAKRNAQERNSEIQNFKTSEF